MAGLLRKRKGKAAASTSEAPRFKTLYHESHFNKFFAAREVLPEIRIKIDDDALSPITAQINLRKWQRLTKPFLMVGYSLVREFYANAWRLEEHKNQPPTYTTQIRGTKINFSPESIHIVLKLRDTPLPNAASYHDRKANNNLRLDEVLDCLYVEGAQWVRHPDGRPHFLRRTNFHPMARGCFNNAMATMQQHYDQRWDTLQQKFDDAQEENRRNFGTINQRMNQMDDQLSFLCYSHQLENEIMLFSYQNTTSRCEKWSSKAFQ
ncbi:hypothetical protein PIB30_096825 [Stylosanthes scabra]|uniref:Putative plant transposon protein domain-containing protein n=1 Tax=Stylosanthes scabra TaxID=79078 RepID=A0ABU6YV29_9FABA|nr:hypothetical protein [Stylosanthes scabra]